MAKAKSTTKAEEKVNEKEEVLVTKDVLEKMFQEAKKEALAELKDEFEAEKNKLEAKAKETSKRPEGYVPETDEQKAWAEERVETIAPIDASEPEEINITVNGETIQILRGRRVKIPRKFALVLENMIDQQYAAKKFQEEVRSQITYVE